MSAPKPRVVALVQARLTSTRLPQKVLAKIGKWTAIELMYRRLQQSQSLAAIVFAIPSTPENDLLDAYLTTELGVQVVRGSEHDVLGRMVAAAALVPADYYLRLTADCPLLCPELVDEVVQTAFIHRADYVTNAHPPSYPDGFDVECVSQEALRWANLDVRDPHWREHVTFGLREHPERPQHFRLISIGKEGSSNAWMRLTLDSPSDLSAFAALADAFGDQLEWLDNASLQRAYVDLDLQRFNGSIVRNEGFALSAKLHQ